MTLTLTSRYTFPTDSTSTDTFRCFWHSPAPTHPRRGLTELGTTFYHLIINDKKFFSKKK